MGIRRAQWRALAALFATVSIILAALSPVVAAQESQVPPGHAQVIASGVDGMPRVEVAWRMTAATAQPGDEAGFFARTLGFVVAQDEPVLVTNGTTGGATLVDAGQALFHPEGASERRSSISDDETGYLNIELIVAAAVEDDATLGTAELIFAGDGFRAPRGDRDVRLTRDVLAPGEEGAFAATSDAPALFHVMAGAIQVTDEDGRVSELSAGDSIELDGDAGIVAGDREGGTWLAASIGERVEVPPLPTAAPDAETGTLEMRLEVCPDGFDAACEPDSERAVVPLAFHHVDDENWIIPDRAAWSDDDTVLTYDDLPVGPYTTGPDDLQPNTRVEGAAWDDEGGWTWTVEPRETTVIRIQLDLTASDAGSFHVILLDCPEGTDLDSDTSACAATEEPWDLWIAPPDGGVDDVRWLSGDAYDLGFGEFLFDGLAAGTWEFSPDEDGPDGPVQVLVTGDAYAIPDLWAVDIEPGERALATVYRVVPDGAGEGTGSLFVTLYDCPAGSDPGSDTSACEIADAPWEVAVDLVGQSDVTTWTLSEYAIAMGDGEYWFELLPATGLVLRPSPEGHEVYVGGDAYLLGEGLWGVDIPFQGAAHVSLYRVLPGGDPVDPPARTGSLVIEQLDCAYGTDPSVDTSACAVSGAPWAVTLTNSATGESWSLLDDGWAYNSGTYVIEALPAGNYAIAVHGNANWDIYGPGSVDVTADDETYVTIYSVDNREP